MNDYYLPLFEAAAAGSLVLTVNKRLARALQTDFDRRMQAGGRAAWRTPDILSLDGWLRRCLAILGEEWRLLDGFAEQRLWEEIIEGEELGAELLQVGLPAKRAAEAHRLLIEYGVDVAGIPLTEDQESFLRWREAFRRRLQQGDWLDSAELAAMVIEALRGQRLPLPPRTLLVGFDELSPTTVALAAALAEGGSLVSEVPPPAAPLGQLQRHVCADRADEIRSAARWVRGLLEQGEQGIGIIVPELKACRRQLERIFREEIDPPAVVQLAVAEARFSLSLGAPLAEQPLVHAALEILAVNERVSLDSAGFLLRCPFLRGGLGEAASRALLDSKLRQWRCEEISLMALQRMAERPGGAPRFAELLRQLPAHGRGQRQQLPGQWAEGFAHLLEVVGWPGERPLTSVEFQVSQAFRNKLLTSLRSLDSLATPIGRGSAMALLRRLAMETEFQAESPPGPVQVVGILEAGGLQFDHLWVMGLSEEVLPSPPRPNPFLPVRLQGRLGMPHATAERELAFARSVAARLFAAAPTVILSHPRSQDDCELRPSPLIAHLPLLPPILAPANDPISLMRKSLPRLEAVRDEVGLPLPTGCNPGGGIAVLRDQALCPFRALARHRLGAKALELPVLGLDAGLRGTLVHRCLELFWRETVDLAGLLNLEPEGLDLRLQRCVTDALGGLLALRPDDYPEPLLVLEGRRVTTLLREWLTEVERQRPQFSVAALEEKHLIDLAGLVLETRVDRVDRLPDGRMLLIDYKTGRLPGAGDLLGERLLEPQLPAYAVAACTQPPAAVALAGVRLGGCKVVGFGSSAELGPGLGTGTGADAEEVTANWEGVLQRWREQLEAIAAAFSMGEAGVDPVTPAKACALCDLASLCRIGDERLAAGEEDE